MRCPTSILLAIALASHAVAQNAFIPIGDLAAPPLNLADQHAPWIEHLGKAGRREEPRGAFTGETALLEFGRSAAWFSPDEVESLVCEITRMSGNDMDTSARTMMLPSARLAAAEEALAWLRQQIPPRVVLTIVLEQLDGNNAKTLLRSERTVRPGATTKVSDVIERGILRDYDVEIAQGAATANPVVQNIGIGACVMVRTRVMPGRDSVILETVARVAEAKGNNKIELEHDGFGDIDRARREIDECGIAFEVPRGESTQQEWTGSTGQRLRLTCSANWTPRPPRSRNDLVVRCGSRLDRPIHSFRNIIGIDPESVWPKQEPTLLQMARIERSRGDQVDIGNDASGSGKLVLLGSAAAATDRQMVDALQTALVPFEASIRVFEVATGEGPEQSNEIARVSASVLGDRWVSFAGRAEQLYIRDWDAEVAQSARVPDPKIDVLSFGHRFDLQVVSDGRGKPTEVAIDAAFERLLEIERIETELNTSMRSGGVPSGDSGTVSPTVVLTQDVVAIERPVLSRHQVRSVLTLQADGSAQLRRAAPRLLGQGRELLFVVSVTK